MGGALCSRRKETKTFGEDETTTNGGEQGLQADHVFKLLLTGEPNVGKSNLLLRFVEDYFSDTYISTIGEDFKTKTVTLPNNAKVKLQIWDTAGSEKFRKMTNSYYKGANGVLVVFDLNNKESFDALPEWFGQIKEHAQEGCHIMLVGNKSDLPRAISEETAKQVIANLPNAQYIETSAKNNWNVDKAFMKLVGSIYNGLKK